MIAGNIARVYFFQNIIQRINISRSLSKDKNRTIFMVFVNRLAELLNTELQPFLQRFLLTSNIFLEKNKIIAP